MDGEARVRGTERIRRVGSRAAAGHGALAPVIRIGTLVASDIGDWSSIRRAQAVVSVSFALVLAACGSAPGATWIPASVPEAATASSCPVPTFDAFIERFSRDVAFQEQMTVAPLVFERYDTSDEPEPRRVVENVPVAGVAWPVMPRLEELRRNGRTYEVAPGTAGRMEVKIRTPDTSDQQIYIFGQSPCWQLQRVVDESI